jgi:hypothetical protein
MQFLPSTWERWGNGNPENIVAAADATARYLCASGGDLSTPRGMALAVFSYNHSFDYVRLVMSVGAKYAGIDPSTLGIDQLPTDKQYRKHRRQEARHHRSRTKTSSGTKTSTSSPKPAATTSPQPSPSPTSSGGGGGGGGSVPVPQPSPSSTLLPTLQPVL